MKVQYLSDIHLELYNKFKMYSIVKKIKIAGDILILCGDIGNPFSYNYEYFINYIADKYKKIFIIAGNHEYYNNEHTIDETNECLEKIAKERENITFLNNSYEIYEGYMFIGTVLWSNLLDKIKANEYVINDFSAIKDMTCEKYNDLHQKSVNFLEETLRNNKEKKIIILSHHLPSYDLIDKEYIKIYKEYNQWFASELDDLMVIYNNTIKYWFYGHTHKSNNSIMYNIQFCCNPIGYFQENINPDYNKNIEI
jgi:predicted MPP superfamily phosphohydrolase